MKSEDLEEFDRFQAQQKKAAKAEDAGARSRSRTTRVRRRARAASGCAPTRPLDAARARVLCNYGGARARAAVGAARPALRRGRDAGIDAVFHPAPGRTDARKENRPRRRGSAARGRAVSVANVHWRAIPARALRSHPRAPRPAPGARRLSGAASSARARGAVPPGLVALGRAAPGGSRARARRGGHGLRRATEARAHPPRAWPATAGRSAPRRPPRATGCQLLQRSSATATTTTTRTPAAGCAPGGRPTPRRAGAPDTGGRRCGAPPWQARLAWLTQEGPGMLAAVAQTARSPRLGLLCAEAPGAVDRLAERWPVKPRSPSRLRGGARSARAPTAL